MTIPFDLHQCCFLTLRYSNPVMSRGKTVNLDVREDLRQGRHPLSKILQTVAGLKADQELRLIAPFQPAPLYSVLAAQGWTASPKQLESGDWEILFTQGQPATASAAPKAVQTPAAEDTAPSSDVIQVDARGLEPPEPLVKILEALATLPARAALRAHTDRRPMHLYQHLEERGLSWETTEQPDGSFITHARPSR